MLPRCDLDADVGERSEAAEAHGDPAGRQGGRSGRATGLAGASVAGRHHEMFSATWRRRRTWRRRLRAGQACGRGCPVPVDPGSTGARAAPGVRSRRLCSARTPSGYLAADIAPSPKSTGVHVGRPGREVVLGEGRQHHERRPGRGAPRRWSARPMVTSTASHTMPAKVANSVWAERPSGPSRRAPADRPRSVPPSAPAMTFICTTLMPEVLAPASLQRAALRASPVVDRRKLTMKSAMMTKTARHR